MSNETPTTEEMRMAYQEYALKDDGSHQDEFDRWLRKVQAEAWREGQQAGWCEGYSRGEPEDNPYL